MTRLACAAIWFTMSLAFGAEFGTILGWLMGMPLDGALIGILATCLTLLHAWRISRPMTLAQRPERPHSRP